MTSAFTCQHGTKLFLSQQVIGPYLFPCLKYLPKILITAAIASFVTDLYNWNQKAVAVLGSISISKVRIDLPWKGVLKKLGKDTFSTAFTLSVASSSQSLSQKVNLPDSTTPSVPAGNLSLWEKRT
ncbi:hypothetical protein PGTUg99_006302 [Puccinia graminis f. sp. tritici]|uniref:Uncharacterized protein n=1 Tax=Puccinia graminis f. sp. tritici TaxID=56615 RepID=A0A5B0NBR0_PUCGR|nr:hypothetical protein PGTUg99_006302 [Puccinia graminis f. sp. tritici]